MSSKKAQGPRGQGKGHPGKQNQDRRGDVGENIKKTESARESKRHAEKAADAQRNKEAASGQLFARLNSGRSNIIVDLFEGEVGLYAFPGGDKPSAHFEVREQLIYSEKHPVTYFEAAQRGHDLQGTAWDTKTYVRVSHLHYGAKYSSKMEGLQGQTQEMMVHYFAELLQEYRQEQFEEQARQTALEREAAREAMQQRLAAPAKDGVSHLITKSDEVEERQRQEQASLQAELLKKRIENASKEVLQLNRGRFGDYVLPNGVVVTLVTDKHFYGTIQVLAAPEGSILNKSKSSRKLRFEALGWEKFSKPSLIHQELYNWLNELRQNILDAVAVKPQKTESVALPAPKVFVKPNLDEAKEICVGAFLGSKGFFISREGDADVAFECDGSNIKLIWADETTSPRDVFEQFDKGLQVTLRSLSDDPCQPIGAKPIAKERIRAYLREIGTRLGLNPNRNTGPSTKVSIDVNALQEKLRSGFKEEPALKIPDSGKAKLGKDVRILTSASV
jgi:hypothetical protein